MAAQINTGGRDLGVYSTGCFPAQPLRCPLANVFVVFGVVSMFVESFNNVMSVTNSSEVEPSTTFFFDRSLR